MRKNKFLISVVGATAIGKTALSIKLAQHYNTEIISCDSRQFYREMRIGTAVPSDKELAAAKHHFIQNRSIHEDYSVGQFEKDALKKQRSSKSYVSSESIRKIESHLQCEMKILLYRFKDFL